MSTSPVASTVRLATTLNAACQCIRLDPDKLRAQLQRTLGESDSFLESRPGLASGSVVFLDRPDAESMDRTTRLIQRALTSPAFVERIDAQAPAIARVSHAATGGLLGLDFHVGGPQPQLIEINTNPGGLLVNLELARALTASCDCLVEPLAGLASGSVALDDMPSSIVAGFREEWRSQRGDTPLATIAIVDDEPAGQYLYPEFRLYQRLFEQAGWHAVIADPGVLEIRDGQLTASGRHIDLVYNRLTDFYLAEPRHAILRSAHESGLVVVTPHPGAHAHWADKRLLAWLRDEQLLHAAGLAADERAHLLRTIPPTELVERHAADDLWGRRKQLFFKPVDGYGSKAAYRGDKLTRSTFEHILAHRYVAQALAPTSSRRVLVDGQATDLRVDIRNYCNRGATWLRAARLYRGQTTNFRTPGGGFAPVLTLPTSGAP